MELVGYDAMQEALLTWNRSGRPNRPADIPVAVKELHQKCIQEGIVDTSREVETITTRNDGNGMDEFMRYALQQLIPRINLNPTLWYMKSGACEVVRHAASILDTSIVPDPEVYNGNHFIWLELPEIRSVQGSDSNNAGALSIDAINSYTTLDDDGKTQLFLVGYSWGNNRLSLSSMVTWVESAPLVPKDDPIDLTWVLRSTFHAARSLIIQKGLFSVDAGDADASRAERRRAKKSGVSLNEVNVVYLGHHHNGGPQTGTGTKMTTRFIVSGHWRNQRCGPGNKYTRTIWISPHIKGPEDAPLVISKTVKVVTP